MKTTIFLFFVTITSSLLISACSSNESKFNGRWKIYAENWSYEETIIRESNEYYVFDDGAYLRTFSSEYDDLWETEGQRFEVIEDKLIMYTKLGGSEIASKYDYEFIGETRLQLTSEDISDYEGGTYNYIFVLDKVED